jgi:hypothetical protein
LEINLPIFPDRDSGQVLLSKSGSDPFQPVRQFDFPGSRSIEQLRNKTCRFELSDVQATDFRQPISDNPRIQCENSSVDASVFLYFGIKAA